MLKSKLMPPKASIITRGSALSGIIALTTILLSHSALANEERLKWTFNQGADFEDASGRTAANINFSVPETDNFQAGAKCWSYKENGFSDFRFVTQTGQLQGGNQVKLRFSGSGKEVEVPATVNTPRSSEEAQSVTVRLANQAPLWQTLLSLDSISYGIPGYSFAQLPLTEGHATIRQFLQTCENYAGSGTQSASSGNNNNASNGLTEKEAFNFTKELDSEEAYRAFLKSYPNGFFAELAKAYLAKKVASGGTNNATQTQVKPVVPKPAEVKEQLVNLGADSAPWYNTNYEIDDGNARTLAAGVTSKGIELVTYCAGGNKMNVLLNEKQRGIYPDFAGRVERGLKVNKNALVRFSNGQSFNIPMVVYGLTGEVAVDTTLQPGGQLMTALMKENGVGITIGTMGSTFNLSRSKVAICNVMKQCGAQVAACGTKRQVTRQPVKPRRAAVPRCRARSVYIEGRGCVLRRHVSQPRTRDTRCRARSVYIEGRGCVLRRSANRPPVRSNGCRQGQIRFEGRCLFRSQLRGYCGPGYTPRGNRCVANPVRQPRPRIQQGVFVTEAFCQSRGLTKEGNYCVEDD